jgi:hypothetical protein
MKARVEFELPTTVTLSLEGTQERESELTKSEPMNTEAAMDAGSDHEARESPRPQPEPELPITAESIDAGSAPDAAELPAPPAEPPGVHPPSWDRMKVGRAPRSRLLPPVPPDAEPTGSEGVDAGGDSDGPPGPPLPPDAIARTFR